MLVTGISFRTSSRFGWPGQLLRTAVLRLLRPYAHFEARYHQRHLQSTTRVIECLRRLDAEMSSLRPYRASEASPSTRMIPALAQGRRAHSARTDGAAAPAGERSEPAPLKTEPHPHARLDRLLEGLVLQEPRIARHLLRVECGAHIGPSRVVVGLIDDDVGRPESFSRL